MFPSILLGVEGVSKKTSNSSNPFVNLTKTLSSVPLTLNKIRLIIIVSNLAFYFLNHEIRITYISVGSSVFGRRKREKEMERIFLKEKLGSENILLKQTLKYQQIVIIKKLFL